MFLKDTSQINTQLQLVRAASNGNDGVKRGVVALDAEWDVDVTRTGQVQRSGPVAVIQIGFFDFEGKPKARVLKLKRGKKPTLPNGLLDLFADPNLTWYGRCIDADLAKITKDWGCSNLLQKVKRVDLGRMASKRGVARSTVSLQQLVAVTLGKQLSKWGQIGTWSGQLLPDQIEYAAMDVLEPLEVYLYLMEKPDLSVRIEAQNANPNTRVFVVPGSGSVTNMSTRLAAGTIVSHTGDWTCPGADRSIKHSDGRRLVRLDSIYASAGKVPFLKVLLMDYRLAPRRHPHAPAPPDRLPPPLPPPHS